MHIVKEHNTDTKTKIETDIPKFTVSDSFEFTPIDHDWYENYMNGVSDYDADRMAHYSVPIVNYVNELKPHVVIGCDRGGRLFTLAVKQMWKELLPDEPFPTLNGGVDFAKITWAFSERRNVYENMLRRVSEIIDTAVKQGEKHDRTVEPNDKIRVLFIDDWTYSGRVEKLVRRMADDLDFEPYFAVMEDHADGDDVVVSASGRMEESRFEKTLSEPLSTSSNTGVMYDENYAPKPYVRESYEYDNVREARRKLGKSVRRVAQHVRHS